MSVPPKYRELGDFHAYYSGKKKAPYLTLFIGGNHEASAYLRELYYGGWVAPNIYYMGAANVLRVGPLRIAGMSGTYSEPHYHLPHGEQLPFSHRDIKTAYHVREFDVRKLLNVCEQVHIGLSHDWPDGIEFHGETDKLLGVKPWLKADSENGRLGNPGARYVMDRLRPPYWFSAHLHTKFPAIVRYGPPGVKASKRSKASKTAEKATAANPDEIDLDTDQDADLGEASKTAEDATAVNPDEIDLDMDEDANADSNEASESAEQPPAANPDEIDLEMDEDVDVDAPAELSETAEQATEAHPGEDVDVDTSAETSKSTEKPDTAETEEVDLEMEAEKDVGAEASEQSAGVSSSAAQTDDVPTSTEEKGVPDDVRAQLPASFTKAAPPRTEKPGQPVPRSIQNRTTRFLALDKCIPGRKYLQLQEVKPFDFDRHKHKQWKPSSKQAPGYYGLFYDAEWLAITRAFAPYLKINDWDAKVPPDLGVEHYRELIKKERQWVETNIVRQNLLEVPHNFAVTAPPLKPGDPRSVPWQPDEYTNPQTTAFCQLVGVPDLWDATPEERLERKGGEERVMAPEGYRGLGGIHRGRGGKAGGRGGRGGRGKR